MDMYKKREIRKKKREENNEFDKSCTSVNINWYPGHMAKTRRKIKENINLIDIIFEVIDSRIPFSSKIKDIDDIIRTKKHIIIMTKKDLCDIKETKKWADYYEKMGKRVILMDLTNNSDYKKLYSLAEIETKDLVEKRKEKGIVRSEIRALVVGVPNAGKSTLINALAGKKVATTGNKPGVTKQVNWLKTNSNLLLLDTPGILWPKIDNQVVSLNLAALTAIKSDILNIVDIATYIIMYLSKNYKTILDEKYKIDSTSDVLENYEMIAKKMGFIYGGEVDYDKVSLRIYNDLASGKIKGVTFDRRD